MTMATGTAAPVGQIAVAELQRVGAVGHTGERAMQRKVSTVPARINAGALSPPSDAACYRTEEREHESRCTGRLAGAIARGASRDTARHGTIGHVVGQDDEVAVGHVCPESRCGERGIGYEKPARPIAARREFFRWGFKHPDCALGGHQRDHPDVMISGSRKAQRGEGQRRQQGERDQRVAGQSSVAQNDSRRDTPAM